MHQTSTTGPTSDAAMAVKFQYDLGESKQAVEVCQSDLHMF